MEDDKARPKMRVGFVLCVGSRDRNTNPYCSTICCMSAIKEAVSVKEREPDAEAVVFFLDIRAHGKDFEEYYARAKELGVIFKQAHVTGIHETDEILGIRYIEHGELREDVFDHVVLAAGVEPPRAARAIGDLFDIKLNKYRFAETHILDPVATSREGIYTCGMFSGPMDATDAVVQGSAAAAKAGALLGPAARNKPQETAVPVPDGPARTGVFICSCESALDCTIDGPSLVGAIADISGVAHVAKMALLCTTNAQDMIKKAIRGHALNRVIVGGCMPHGHEALFRNLCRAEGLNPSFFDMVPLHGRTGDEAQQALEQAVTALVNRHAAADGGPIAKKALIIGGGVAGMTAALDIAALGFDAVVVEKESELGGNLRFVRTLLENEDPQAYLRRKINDIAAEPRITVKTGAHVTAAEGDIGAFRVTLEHDGQSEADVYGAVVIATGAQGYVPATGECAYGDTPAVITQRELETRIADKNVPAESVVMIQCVGSRDKTHPYCSRICCGEAVKNAIALRALNPRAKVTVIHNDIRTYGFKEDYYVKARENGITFIRHKDGIMPAVEKGREGLAVRVTDYRRGEFLLHPDLIVLSTGLVPNEENAALAAMLKVPIGPNSFFREAHMIMNPVDFERDGIFVCGLAHGPKFIEENIAQASAAASRVATILSHDTVRGDLS